MKPPRTNPDEVIAQVISAARLCDSHATNRKTCTPSAVYPGNRAPVSKFNGCCSEQCCEELPCRKEQRRRRAGRENGNKIFNKSRGRI